MATQYRIVVTETIEKRAERIAEMMGHTVEEMLPVLLMLSTPVFNTTLDVDCEVNELSDADVLELSQLQLLPQIQSRHSALVESQNTRRLLAEEYNELNTLHRLYELGLLYKSAALEEAVKRGLREPLAS